MNPEAVAEWLLTAQESSALIGATLHRFSGTASFRVGQLTTTVDCDARSYNVLVQAVQGFDRLSRVDAIPPRRGC